jgi:hypothetical protein
MLQRIVYLFPDTNFFIQCRPPEELDWSAWSSYDEVQLVVTRPVQREIDSNKNKGNDRLGRRARKVSSRFRHIILSGQDHELVRAAGPCVKLLLNPECPPNPALSGRLNYQHSDDELVGTVHAFREQYPNTETRLLTHDTGPMAAARMVGILVTPIPAEWLLPPENTQEEKRINALTQELERLRKSEPEFHIKCVDATGNEIERLEGEFLRYDELSTEELSCLMERIRERCPIETDFGSRTPTEKELQFGGIRIPIMKRIYTPATEKEIADYRDMQYPTWLAQCEDILRSYHNAAERQAPIFHFIVSNDGTRPGKDALVKIEAKGGLKIIPLGRDDEGNDNEKVSATKRAELPRAPRPPRGKWNVTNLAEELNRSLRAIRELSFTTLPNPDYSVPLLANPSRGRDPNAFYWTPERPMTPQSSFSLECEQWRHSLEARQFGGEICLEPYNTILTGALECQIHAENLSRPAEMRIPVRIRVKTVRVFPMAEKLVESLVPRKHLFEST